MSKPIDIQTVVANLDEQVSRASDRFYQWAMTGDEWEDPSWTIETCYMQLLAALEALDMTELRDNVYAEYAEVKQSGGFSLW